MAGIISTGSTPKALWPGVKAWWGTSYASHGQEWADLFETSPSTQNYEEDVALTGFGLAPVKSESEGTAYDTSDQAYTTRYVHVAYSLGYIVTYEEIKDNLYPKVSKSRTTGLAFSMASTKNIVAANIYNRAFDSDYTYGDGVELIATTHPTRDGTQANELANAVDFSEAALEDLVILIGDMDNTRGLPIGILARSLHVPTALEFDATRVLNSVLQSNTANNDVNAIRYQGSIPQGCKVNHFFTDTDAFFLRTNCPEGMKHYEREAISFRNDGDFDTDNQKHKAYDRYSFGNTDFRGLAGSPGV